MKLIIVILSLITCIAFGQSADKNVCHAEIDTLTSIEVFTVVEKMPAVDGGMQTLFKEVSKKIRYPHMDRYSIDSKVVVAFIVDHNGQISGKRILKNIAGTDIGEQLLDLVDDLKWQPGICHGKAVSTLQVLPMILEFR